MRLVLFLPLLVAACTSFEGPDELELLIAESDVDCGTLVYDSGQESSPDPTAALECFNGAAKPHVEQQFITDEGDPISEHFFVEDGHVVAIRDTRGDEFGDGDLIRVDCPAGLTAADQFGWVQLVCVEP